MPAPYPDYRPDWLVAENALVRRGDFDRAARCNWPGCHEPVSAVDSTFNPDYRMRVCALLHPQADLGPTEDVREPISPNEGPFATAGLSRTTLPRETATTNVAAPSPPSASSSDPGPGTSRSAISTNDSSGPDTGSSSDAAWEAITSPEPRPRPDASTRRSSSSAGRSKPAEDGVPPRPAGSLPPIYNRRTLPGGSDPPGSVYVGRPSPWGNPTRMQTEADRERACDEFETYAAQRLLAEPGWLAPLRGKALVDWCLDDDGHGTRKGRRCHAETLRRLANA